MYKHMPNKKIKVEKWENNSGLRCTCFLRLTRMTQSKLTVLTLMPFLTADKTDVLMLSLRQD